LNKDNIVLFGAGIFATGALLVALIVHFYVAMLGMLLAGFAWLTVLATLNAVAQHSVSMWVRARAISVYLMIFFAGMAIGSSLWGIVATHLSLPMTQVCAAVGLIAGNLLTYFFSLDGHDFDHTPTQDSPAPHPPTEPKHHQGPIMIMIEYDINPSNVKAFSLAMRDLRTIRLREGAFFWSLFNDIENPTKHIECFMAETWLEHLRFHERVSVSDRRLIAKAKSFHEGTLPPLITHYVANEIPRRAWRRLKKKE
jgi:MFS family permease